MNLDDLIPPHVTAAVRDLGLHKVAGAILGVPELTIKEAVATLGAKAYLRRKEARSIVDGIAAFAVLTNEKVAESPALMALLRRAAMPALAGAGIAAVPQMLSNDPMQQHQSLLPAMGMGALLGGAGGALHSMHGLPSNVSQDVAQALR
jgi:hypothetical protein